MQRSSRSKAMRLIKVVGASCLLSRAVKFKLGLAKGDVISIAQRHRHTDPATVDEGTITAAQVDQVKIASVHMLKHGVVSRNPAIAQDKAIVVAAAHGPTIAAG